MPSFSQHCAETTTILGQSFEEVHRWLDEFAGKPPYGMRHRKLRHHLAGIGTNVGPDISDTPRTKDAAALLVDILNPNTAIDGNYISYQVTTKSGESSKRR